MSILQKHGNLTLYCVAYEVRRLVNRKIDVRVGFEYLHALDAANARFQFLNAHTRVRGLHITGIAPAVGFEAKDSHGEKLIT
jgi:hypothetical protein